MKFVSAILAAMGLAVSSGPSYDPACTITVHGFHTGDVGAGRPDRWI